MNLWPDDCRTPPDASWTWVRTVAEAILMMEAGNVSHASLDNDLGQNGQGERLPEGRTLVYWMAERGFWPSDEIAVHSANVVAVAYMVGTIERYGPFRRVGTSTRFVRAPPA